MKNSAFLLVNQEVLPQVFTKVIQAKEYLRTAQASSTTEAAKMAGISRSVFYKYKDDVFAYHGRKAGRIVTMQLTLDDRPGVLSSLLSQFTTLGANILTVNQSIPVGGSALVSISASVEDETPDTTELIEQLGALEGVRSIGSISDD